MGGVAAQGGSGSGAGGGISVPSVRDPRVSKFRLGSSSFGFDFGFAMVTDEGG